MITSDIDEALSSNATNWAILIPPFNAGGDRALANNRVRDISRALALAAESTGHVTVIDPALFAYDRTITLIPDLELSPLQSVDRRSEPALSGPLSLYRHGHLVAGDRADWDLDLLHYDQSANWTEDGQPEFDISGGARVLAWGPHITLPRGHWRLKLRFLVDDRAARQGFTFDWGPLSAYTRLEAKPGRAGFHEACIDHLWTNHEVAELRLSLQHAAFSGKVTLLSINVEFLSKICTEEEAELRASDRRT